MSKNKTFKLSFSPVSNSFIGVNSHLEISLLDISELGMILVTDNSIGVSIVVIESLHPKKIPLLINLTLHLFPHPTHPDLNKLPPHNKIQPTAPSIIFTLLLLQYNIPTHDVP